MDPLEELSQKKKLDSGLVMSFEAKYGKTFFKALEFIQKEGPKVTKNTFKPSKLITWTVQGKDRCYLVYPRVYCQCQSFLINTIYRKKTYFPCKHLLAQRLAEILDQFVSIEHADKAWSKFLKDF